MTLPDAGGPLDSATATAAFETIFNGHADDADLTRFLTVLSDRGETAAEIAAAAQALRRRAVTIAAPAGAIDVCGTGGDGRHTLNVSTAVAIVVAACGVPVAKHGNRAASSKSGAADVLEALGVRTDVPPPVVERGLRDLGIGFLHAAHHHAAMAHVAAVRRAIGRRTIFNLLGPLANPAGVARQLVGVYSADALPLMAATLQQLGTDAAMVVHGTDGIDELTVTGPSYYIHLVDDMATPGEVHPHDAGLAVHPSAALTGGAPAENAAALTALLEGAGGAYRDIVLLNAAAALRVANAATGWRDGAVRAATAIDSGDARALLQRWREYQ